MLSPKLAYIDPGSGSMILQVILGGVAAAAVMAKFWWRRFLVLLRIREPVDDRREDAEMEVEPLTGERAGQRSEPAARR